ncbi:MAG TPA: hypothetical protein VK558_11780 [Patescibacteria group bacterium]|nr:hypothetical protein [Patescibacteria group bacterium]
MSLFIPLRKVDASQRLVYGQIDETPDRSGEVFDYASSKPHFEQWSADIRKASDGKSLGNVRAMHGKVAAGKLEDIAFDDITKRIQLCARIVDDGEWKKVEQGVYTGFSPGGRYLRKWDDGGLTRYTAEPSEISIVDMPCIPSASFTMVKADGAEEQVAFRFRKADDADTARYSEGDLADLFGSLDWLWQSGDWQDAWAVDGKPMDEGLKDWLEQGSSLVQALIDDGADGSGDADPDPDADPDADPDLDADKGRRTRGLRKAGARNSAADLALIQTMHDTAVSLGAVCPNGIITSKAAATGELAKVHGLLGEAKDALTKLIGERDSLTKRVTALEALPKAGGPALKAVAKGQDVTLAPEQDEMAKIAAMDNREAQSLALIKLAHRKPQVARF